MADETSGGSPKKLSTAEILAQARKSAGTTGGESATPPAAKPAAEPAAEAPDAAEQPAPGPAKPAPGGTPKSTKDILAAARAAASNTPIADKAAAGGEAVAKAAPAAGGAQSTKDILAAARAAAGKAPAAPAEKAEKPAAAVKASPNTAPVTAAKSSPEQPAGEKPSVAEILKAVRAARDTGVVIAAPEPPKPKKPVMPVKPAAKGKAESAVPRRNAVVAFLLSPLAMAWTFFTAATAIASLGCVRFMLPNVLTEPPSKFKIGPPSDYDLGKVATKWTAQYGVWIVHTDQYQGKNLIYALRTVCTHLGCTPSWLEGEQKFKCPCHGSGFYVTGINFEGPAPRPLERVGLRVAPDGMLEVDKSLKFQEEMGQWKDATSYVEVV